MSLHGKSGKPSKKKAVPEGKRLVDYDTYKDGSKKAWWVYIIIIKHVCEGYWNRGIK
jgi:hypothetical protein